MRRVRAGPPPLPSAQPNNKKAGGLGAVIHGAGPTDTIPYVFRTASDSVISRQTVMNIDGFTVAIISRLSWTVVRRNTCFQRFFFRHSHGGTGCGSAHKPFLASRAAFPNSLRTASS